MATTPQIRPPFRRAEREIRTMFDRMEAAPARCTTTSRSLTHQIDLGDWRAVMDSTQAQSGGFRTPDRWNSVPIPERVALRAYERVEVDENGCWISTYSVASHGYAQIGWQTNNSRHVVLAHRAAWVHVNGQMPLGMTLDHVCRVRRCVNPSHLRILPNFENARRINGEDFPLGQCRRGHPNTMLEQIPRRTKSGLPRTGLACGECLRERQRAWAAANPRKRVAPTQIRARRQQEPRTECRKGHPWTEENIYSRPDGSKECRTCKRASRARAKASSRARGKK